MISIEYRKKQGMGRTWIPGQIAPSFLTIPLLFALRSLCRVGVCMHVLLCIGDGVVGYWRSSWLMEEVVVTVRDGAGAGADECGGCESLYIVGCCCAMALSSGLGFALSNELSFKSCSTPIPISFWLQRLLKWL